MRVGRVAGCFAVVLWLGGCHSQERQAERARQAAHSWIAGIGLTCSEWRAGHVPARFATRAVRDARRQLQRTLAQLPAAEHRATLAAAAAADCFASSGKRP